MWIKELPIDNERKSFREDVAFLWKCDERPIYISDNHLTAAWCWLQECEPNERYNFIHIDQHADLSDKGEPEIIEKIKYNPNSAKKAPKSLVKKSFSSCVERCIATGEVKR